MQVFHGARRDKWLLRVKHDVTEGIHADLVVRHVHPHRLLTHRTLISVTRRLVVVGEGNNGGTDAKNHRRVNLAVRVADRNAGVLLDRVATGNKIIDGHGNHGRFLFFSVDVLDKTRRDEFVPGVPCDVLLRQQFDVLLFDLDRQGLGRRIPVLQQRLQREALKFDTAVR